MKAMLTNANVSVLVRNVCAGLFWTCLELSTVAAGWRDTAFSNHGTNEIYVTQVRCDGKIFDVACGVLVLGAQKTHSFFPERIPKVFSIEYMERDRSVTQSFSGLEIKEFVRKATRLDHVTLHFIYTRTNTFIPKLEISGEDAFRHSGKLWPDEKNPDFSNYKRLVVAAYDGKLADVRELIRLGTPHFWREDPVTMTPLEWAVRRNHEAIFLEFSSSLPAEYPLHNYANAIKLAAQDGKVKLLSELMGNPISKRVDRHQLRGIFYSASGFNTNTDALQLLMKSYSVGVDFQVRDFGHTLLFVAVQHPNLVVAEWLVANGADRNATLKNGMKPIDVARDEKMRRLLFRP